MAIPKLNLGLQALAGSVTLALLDTDLTNLINKINPLETEMNDFIATKGQADGLCPLGPDGVIPGAYIGSVYSTETFVVTSMVALTAASLVHPVTGKAPETGDIALINTGDESTQKTMILVGTDHTVAADWSEFIGPTDGVFALSNVSGSVVNQRGSVTLADVAFSGTSAVVSYDHAGDNYITASTVEGALGELDAQAKTNADSISAEVNARVNADTGLQNQINSLSSTSVATSDYKVGVVMPGDTASGTNAVFTVPDDYVAGSLFLTWNGQVWYSGYGFTTVAGTNNVTLDITPPAGSEAPRAHYLKV